MFEVKHGCLLVYVAVANEQGIDYARLVVFVDENKNDDVL